MRISKKIFLYSDVDVSFPPCHKPIIVLLHLFTKHLLHALHTVQDPGLKSEQSQAPQQGANLLTSYYGKF